MTRLLLFTSIFLLASCSNSANGVTNLESLPALSGDRGRIVQIFSNSPWMNQIGGVQVVHDRGPRRQVRFTRFVVDDLMPGTHNFSYWPSVEPIAGPTLKVDLNPGETRYFYIEPKWREPLVNLRFKISPIGGNFQLLTVREVDELTAKALAR